MGKYSISEMSADKGQERDIMSYLCKWINHSNPLCTMLQK